jgi:hypothetical protein
VWLRDFLWQIKPIATSISKYESRLFSVNVVLIQGIASEFQFFVLNNFPEQE